MTRDPRLDILFEPVRIGPVTTRNRFYQVPHASSTGVDIPNTRKGLRAIRAEDGWGVVCTGYCSIHPSSDDAPHRYSRLWDDENVKNLALMVDAVHEHGALAGVGLFYGSSLTSNRATREMPLSPSGLPRLQAGGRGQFPLHSRAMDRDDIRNLRTWQVDAAKRAKSAGSDIIYVYAGMSFGPYQFISRRTNRRNDEYGGSLENRVRLLREMVEDTKEAVGDTCAVAVRFSVDELMGELGLQWHDEGRGVFERPAVLTQVLGIVYRAIATFLIRRAGLRSGAGARTGAVTLIQRFGSALNLNIHLHMLFVDGVYTFDDVRPCLHRGGAPAPTELQRLLHTIAIRVARALEKQGLLLRDDDTPSLDLEPADAFEQLLAAAVHYRIATGPHTGRKALTLRTVAPNPLADNPCIAQLSGFSLHSPRMV